MPEELPQRRSPLKRALIAATFYVLVLFAVGFVLGTIRVLFVAPRLGLFGATMAEVPVMLAAASLTCRWVMRRWQPPPAIAIRGAMVLWFLALLLGFETLLGATLFARTLADQWATLTTPAGLLGLSAQLLAALLPLWMGRASR